MPDAKIKKIPSKLSSEDKKKVASQGILIAFPDAHDPYNKPQGWVTRPGPITNLLSKYTYKIINLLLLPQLMPNIDSLLPAIKQIAPHSEIQVTDCSDFFKATPMEMLTFLRAKFIKIRSDFPEEEINICLGGITYPALHASILSLCMAGELPCRIITVRPSRILASPISQFEETDFSANFISSSQERVGFFSGDSLALNANLKNAEQFGIVGTRTSLGDIIDTCSLLAPSSFPILILGETGTGKGLFAKYIHSVSGRPKDSFVEINCAAIPENLVESVLFGHKRGAFTGAVTDQVGKFVQANGGTLFLDEIGDMPMQAQAKILRVLEDGVVDVLGAEKTIKVDVKIIAATNYDLQERIQENKFRADLYYRLNLGEVHIPPLRERAQDICGIALRILKRVNATLPFPKILTTAALGVLEKREWKGNIRELENVLERTLLVSPKLIIGSDDILFSGIRESSIVYKTSWEPGILIEDYLQAVRQDAFEQALEISNGNQSAAARLLGVSHQAINQFVAKKKIESLS